MVKYNWFIASRQLWLISLFDSRAQHLEKPSQRSHRLKNNTQPAFPQFCNRWQRIRSTPFPKNDLPRHLDISLILPTARISSQPAILFHRDLYQNSSPFFSFLASPAYLETVTERFERILDMPAYLFVLTPFALTSHLISYNTPRTESIGILITAFSFNFLPSPGPPLCVSNSIFSKWTRFGYHPGLINHFLLLNDTTSSLLPLPSLYLLVDTFFLQSVFWAVLNFIRVGSVWLINIVSFFLLKFVV